MLEGIPRIENEAYFISYSKSRKGDKDTPCIMMPLRTDWGVF